MQLSRLFHLKYPQWQPCLWFTMDGGPSPPPSVPPPPSPPPAPFLEVEDSSSSCCCCALPVEDSLPESEPNLTMSFKFLNINTFKSRLF